MTRVLLYWNHICVLHKGEKQFLHRLSESLGKDGIELEVRYFGLGYPEHMSEYLAKPDAELPDIVVSADLEVFENHSIYRKFQDELYPVADWIPLREGACLEAVRREKYLLPFLAIPLVYYTRQPGLCRKTLLREWEGLAFGGINNSAAKTLVKSVWSHWGEEAVGRLLGRSRITDMPIGAFQAVRMGKCHTALVPSIYALRADGRDTFLVVPVEGPVLIPSYFCARRTVPMELARRLAREILCPELCDFYEEQGDMIVYPDYREPRGRCGSVKGDRFRVQGNGRYMTPEAGWLEALEPEVFYDTYCRYIPGARRMSGL